MSYTVFSYPFMIKEVYLDTFGHMNNAMYLVLFEEARWEFITQNGYGLKKIMETGLGPTILEIKLKFLKELRLRDKIIIETQVTSYQNRIINIGQKMLRENVICCEAEFTIGFFSLKERKIVQPSDEWLKALGI